MCSGPCLSLGSNWKHQEWAGLVLSDRRHCKDLGAKPLNSEAALSALRNTSSRIPAPATICRHQGCVSWVLPQQLPLLCLVFSFETLKVIWCIYYIMKTLFYVSNFLNFIPHFRIFPPMHFRDSEREREERQTLMWERHMDRLPPARAPTLTGPEVEPATHIHSRDRNQTWDPSACGLTPYPLC